VNDPPHRLLARRGVNLVTLASHLAEHGPPPRLGGPHLLTGLVEAAGLTGRGGAFFPTGRKLRAVAAAPGPRVVVGNGAEGEPASAKDQLLLATAPHLVLDGLRLVAEAVDARQAYLYLPRTPALIGVVRAAVAERTAAWGEPVPVELATAPHRFIAGEESALASRLSGGPARPRFTPPRVSERGVRARPTLVQNVETLAHIALVARYGPAWFRTLGTPNEPGTMLCTVGGAVARPAVVEVPVGTPLREVLAAAGGIVGRVSAILLGGYHGTWLDADQAVDLPLCQAALRPHGAALGCRVIVALPADVCGLVETARVARYLAEQSAGQCGPCHNGLPALAAAFVELAGPGPHRTGRARIDQLTTLVEGRGACHHPDGTVRFLRSALRVFSGEIARHEHGRCVGLEARIGPHAPVGQVGAGLLPVPACPSGPDSWR
jgi:NADH:ubiquinone oxidoreductase, NADH-binding (51 kD) subunit